MPMSNLRRRVLGDSSSASSSRSSSPAQAFEGDQQGDGSVSVPITKIEKINQQLQKAREAKHHAPKEHRKRRNAWIFGLGGLFGVLVALFFAGNNDVLDLHQALKNVNLDSLMDVLPVGFVKDAEELQRKERDAVAYDSFAVGLHARSQGVEATHPVIMIPGVISTGLESWSTETDAQQYFRKRLWGSWSMMRALVMDKAGWKRHIMVDKETGLDPPGVKLRAAQGFDAADFFITGYWIWNKILENLATIGYDPTNAFTAAYDWRLSYGNLEVRDQYFTRLKSYIEMAKKIQGKKVCLLSHSMGSQVLYYFFHWVEAEGHGNGGPNWVEEYVDSWINISGCMLGAAKGFPAVLSGEMKDTAQLSPFAVYGLEKFLSRHERAELFRAMPGISSMLPIGGNAVWGDSSGAPDDREGQDYSFGNFMTFRESAVKDDPEALFRYAENLTAEGMLPYLFGQSESWYRDLLLSNYSHGVATSRAEVEANQKDPGKWINPLETRLPLAPNLKIYCFYGIGKETERAYFYKRDTDPGTKTNVTIDTSYSIFPANEAAPANMSASQTGPDLGKTHPIEEQGDPEAQEGSTAHTSTHTAKVDHGVVMGEGDGTVNLLSTGYMCTRGWTDIKRYNPAGVKVTTYEMPHEPDRFSPRGGPNTGDHVDILGRSSLNDLILKIAGGREDMVGENVESRVREYARKVKIYEDE